MTFPYPDERVSLSRLAILIFKYSAAEFPLNDNLVKQWMFKHNLPDFQLYIALCMLSIEAW